MRAVFLKSTTLGKMVRHPLYGAVLGAVLLMGGGAAAPDRSAYAMTLQEALVSAYETNPTLQARRSRLEATDESVPQALAGWRPRVEILGDYERRRTRQDLTPPKDTRDIYSTRLRITQNLYNGGKTTSSVDAAESNVLAERARLNQTERDVLREATRVYLDVFRDEVVLRLRRQNEDRLRQQLQATQDRFDVGEVTRTDVAQAEARVSRVVSERVRAQGNLEAAKAAFLQIIGVPPATLEEPDAAPQFPTDMELAVNLAIENNPQVLAAIYDHEAALSRIDVEIADLLPQVDLVGEAAYLRNQQFEDTDSRRLSVTAQLTVPIYQQGFETSQIRSNKKQAAQAVYAIEEARRLARAEATSAWETYQSTRAEIEAINEEIRVARIALEGVEQEATVGQRTVLDILDAEQELLDAQVSLVRANRDSTLAQYDVLAAAGLLDARNLDLEVEYYDPQANYDAVRDQWWGLGDEVENPPPSE